MTCLVESCTTAVQNPWEECREHRKMRTAAHYGADPIPVATFPIPVELPSVLDGLI